MTPSLADRHDGSRAYSHTSLGEDIQCRPVSHRKFLRIRNRSDRVRWTYLFPLDIQVEKRVQIMIEKDLIPKYVEATRSAHSEMTATLSQELSRSVLTARIFNNRDDFVLRFSFIPLPLLTVSVKHTWTSSMSVHLPTQRFNNSSPKSLK